MEDVGLGINGGSRQEEFVNFTVCKRCCSLVLGVTEEP